jgi:leucyl aminopeptidase
MTRSIDVPITFTASRDLPDDVELLAVPVFADLSVPAGAPVELDNGFLRAAGFDGKVGKSRALPADDGTMVLAVGMGDKNKVDAEVFRRAAARLVSWTGPARRAATTLLAAGPAVPGAAQAVAEGAALAAYRYNDFKSDGKHVDLEQLVVVGGGGASLQKALDRGAAIAGAVNLARDLINGPAGSITPRKLAAVATDVAKRAGLTADILDEKAIKAARLGALAGVAAGSDEPARLIRLTYEPAGRARGTVALVGKGITFDSGGLSLKTADGMMTMKTDMSGAAAVIATMSVLGALGCKVRVIGIAPTTENMPGGAAIKPGDVLTARNGKTIEVLNTDAEGRLVLADGLSLATEAGVDAIVDLATLTGAQVVALGRKIAAVLGNNDAFVDQVSAAAARAGEGVWHLPLPDEYRRDIDSEVADMKNIGRPGQAGTLIAGLFLREFVDDTPWAHLDIAGPSRSDEDSGYLRRGATGFGVRTLIELLTTFEKPKR